MIAKALVASTPLDDFLSDTGSSQSGERLQQLGLAGSLLGVVLAIGIVVFLRFVHAGSRREIIMLIRLISMAGALAFVGACIELAGVASVGDITWVDGLTDATGRAATLRLAGGVLVLFGAVPSVVDRGDGFVTWRPTVSSLPLVVGVAAGVMSFWFDGHTRTEGVRIAHIVVNAAHVLAGGVWLGGVIALAIIAWHRRQTERPIAAVAVRFASVVAVALVAVALAGSLMTLMVIDGLSDLYRTDWGRALLVKVGAVAITAAIGAYNHFRVVPALEQDETDRSAGLHLRRTATVEAGILLLVALLTVWLTTASTN